MANSTPLCGDDVLTSAPAHSRRFRSPLVYWHLLSLDAPTVAMLWTWFIADSNGVKLPLTSILAMGIAVWILYAVDRLLDARSTSDGQLELRHRFHRDHRRVFFTGILLSSLLLAFLVVRLNLIALRLYATLAAPLAGYFFLIHLRRRRSSGHPMPRLPKEIAVGVFFSAAIFIPVIARNPTLRMPLLPVAALFGLLCCLNCLFIYSWEHPPSALVQYPEAHPATRLALRFLSLLSMLGVAGGLGLGMYNSHSPWQLGLAISLAAASLMQLNFSRHRLDPVSLRAAGDLCLLTPLLLVFALR